VTVDLPWGDERATFGDLADVAANAVTTTRDERAVDRPLIVVAQSLGGFVGPLVCSRVRCDLLVMVAAMVPRPGESAGEWWTNTGFVSPQRFDEHEIFLHDVAEDLAAESAHHVTEPASHLFDDPWPLERWPDVPTRFLLCRDDRFFTADFQRRVVPERLGIEPDEMSGGHLAFLARPDELVGWLERYRVELDV
jgi:pimeloyl-ACP methyl ester carboxylesterase